MMLCSFTTDLMSLSNPMSTVFNHLIMVRGLLFY